ncbi:MAG TPA: TVP38/TMEM64 family protein, partial [Mobilitalea sp.]|nr:TVP38/TMEM64 family protein [Mobilitalea sp.]
IYGYKNGLFSSIDSFRSFFEGFGIWTALVFVLIQLIQVVIPIIPGAIGCVAGVIIFGPWYGLLYNYIGICVGSTLAFLLSRRYGTLFVRGMIGTKSYDKYINWINRGKKFDIMFALAIFFPVAPDDLLCYIAGLTKMELKRFIAIILLGKPLSIALYSIGLTTIGHYFYILLK